MRTELKYFLAAFLSISSGIAFAYPLYYMGYVEPLNRVPEGPKPNLKLDVVYANFTLQPSNSSLPIPTWYDTSRDGSPDFLSFDVVVNVTNYSNRTALIDQLSLCTGNSTVSFQSLFQRSSSNGTVEGVWLDGKWLNVSWVPSSNGIPAHWREGVTVERTFVNGTLTSVSMDVNGSWVDVTDRVRLLEKDTIMPMSGNPVMTDIIASGEIRFFNPSQWQPSEELPLYSVTNVNLDDGFSNQWEAGQSRLMVFQGVLPISSRLVPDIVERLNSDLTIVRIQAGTKFQDSDFNGVHMNTHKLETVHDTISLTMEGTSRIYNPVLTSNQMFKLDSYGVEVFIEPRS
jgi:hypothetical protein